jgi:hypothetical protein
MLSYLAGSNRIRKSREVSSVCGREAYASMLCCGWRAFFTISENKNRGRMIYLRSRLENVICSLGLSKSIRGKYGPEIN